MLTTDKIAEYAKTPDTFISLVEESYFEKVHELAISIRENPLKKIVLLAGPSASGKTTTSHILRKDLERRNIKATVLSLDNFYGGNHKMPTLPNGTPDFESVYSLDLDEIHRSLNEIILNNKTYIPVFDFINHVRAKEKELIDIGDNGVLIVEGLHALNPVITDSLPKENLFKIYISVSNSIYNKTGEKVLNSRDMRLIRRLSRDAVYRNSDSFNTLHLWTGVVLGEEKYLYKFKPTADVRLGTLHAYEPCIFKDIILKLLENINETYENHESAVKIKNALKLFPSISPDKVPKSSLIREFL